MQTPENFMPRRTVIAHRTARGSVDYSNLPAWAMHFVEYVKDLIQNGRNVLLTYGAYQAHLSLSVLHYIRENNIIMFVLPVH